jgi:hypothetical protein
VRHDLQDSPYAARRAEVERGDPRRLRHVASENDRVRRVVEALESEDVEAPVRSFAQATTAARRFRGLDARAGPAVDLAYAAGAVAARLTGGGLAAPWSFSRVRRPCESLGRVVTRYGDESRKRARASALRTSTRAARRGTRPFRPDRYSQTATTVLCRATGRRPYPAGYWVVDRCSARESGTERRLVTERSEMPRCMCSSRRGAQTSRKSG